MIYILRCLIKCENCFFTSKTGPSRLYSFSFFFGVSVGNSYNQQAILTFCIFLCLHYVVNFKILLYILVFISYEREGVTRFLPPLSPIFFSLETMLVYNWHVVFSNMLVILWRYSYRKLYMLSSPSIAIFTRSTFF